MPKSRAWEKGHWDYQVMKRRSDNPYLENSTEFYEWREGYDIAALEDGQAYESYYEDPC